LILRDVLAADGPIKGDPPFSLPALLGCRPPVSCDT